MKQKYLAQQLLSIFETLPETPASDSTEAATGSKRGWLESLPRSK
jgi:hypothetical protein